MIESVNSNELSATPLPSGTIDGTNFCQYVSGGQVRKLVSTISGLGHLEGVNVAIVVDGSNPSVEQGFVVTSGSITLPNKAAVVHVGLLYNGTIKFLQQSEGGINGTGQTKKRRTYNATLRVYRSIGGKIGTDVDNLDIIYYQTPNDPLGVPPNLVTDDIDIHFDNGWSKTEQITIKQEDPLPFFLLASVFRSEVEEK